MSGTLVIKPLSAKLTHDTEFVGTMDPYCRITFGSQQFKTAVCKNGGKTPAWTDQFTMRKTVEDQITIDILEHDTFSRDDYVAQGFFALTPVFLKGQSTEWINLAYKGKPAGQILVDFSFIPDQGQGQYPQMQGQQFPMQQPMMQPMQQPMMQPMQQPMMQPMQQPMMKPMQQPMQQPMQYPQQQMPQYPQQMQYPPQQFPPQQFPPQQYPPQMQMPQYMPPQQQGPQYMPPQQQGPQYMPPQFMQMPQQGGLPIIQFNQHCKKCSGTGRKKGRPCGKCYERAGYCKKCCGTGIDQKKGGKCKCKK